MKVICINATPQLGHFQRLKEGEQYTVIGEGINPISGDENYLLAEILSANPYHGWLKSRFIPLSDIDETELERHIQRKTCVELSENFYQ